MDIEVFEVSIVKTKRQQTLLTIMSAPLPAATLEWLRRENTAKIRISEQKAKKKYIFLSFSNESILKTCFKDKDYFL